MRKCKCSLEEKKCNDNDFNFQLNGNVKMYAYTIWKEKNDYWWLYDGFNKLNKWPKVPIFFYFNVQFLSYSNILEVLYYVKTFIKKFSIYEKFIKWVLSSPDKTDLLFIEPNLFLMTAWFIGLMFEKGQKRLTKSHISLLTHSSLLT